MPFDDAAGTESVRLSPNVVCYTLVDPVIGWREEMDWQASNEGSLQSNRSSGSRMRSFGVAHTPRPCIIIDDEDSTTKHSGATIGGGTCIQGALDRRRAGVARAKVEYDEPAIGVDRDSSNGELVFGSWQSSSRLSRSGVARSSSGWRPVGVTVIGTSLSLG